MTKKKTKKKKRSKMKNQKRNPTTKRKKKKRNLLPTTRKSLNSNLKVSIRKTKNGKTGPQNLLTSPKHMPKKQLKAKNTVKQFLVLTS